jgi:hypothetical protein
MRMDEKTTPFVVAGGGIYQLQFANLDPMYHLSGLGMLVGGGVDFTPQPTISIRAEVGLHIWSAEEESGGGGVAQTVNVGIGVGANF